METALKTTYYLEMLRPDDLRPKTVERPGLRVERMTTPCPELNNPGQIWCQTPEQVKVHDFPNQAVGRAVPYGIYDLQHNHGTVYVGQSADTPALAWTTSRIGVAPRCPTAFPTPRT
jgi:hypothetical protein